MTHSADFKTIIELEDFIQSLSDEQRTNRSYLRSKLTNVTFSEHHNSITVVKVGNTKCTIDENIGSLKYRHSNVHVEHVIDYIGSRIALYRKLRSGKESSKLSDITYAHKRQIENVELSKRTVLEILDDLGIDLVDEPSFKQSKLVCTFGNWSIRVGADIEVTNNVIDINDADCKKFIHVLSTLQNSDITELIDEIELHARLCVQLRRFELEHDVVTDADTTFIRTHFLALYNTDYERAEPIYTTLGENMHMEVVKQSSRAYTCKVFSTNGEEKVQLYEKTFTNVTQNMSAVIDHISIVYNTFLV